MQEGDLENLELRLVVFYMFYIHVIISPVSTCDLSLTCYTVTLCACKQDSITHDQYTAVFPCLLYIELQVSCNYMHLNFVLTRGVAC